VVAAGRVAVEVQILDLDVNELIDPRSAEEQRLNHEPVLAVRLICTAAFLAK
jgi:hypothetical protein